MLHENAGKVWRCTWPLALAVLFSTALPSASLAAKVFVTPPAAGGAPSPAYQNFQSAINLLRQQGETGAADSLQSKLEKGELAYDSAESAADTSSFGAITIPGQAAGLAAAGGTVSVFDPLGSDLQKIIELARTLFHENIHAVEHVVGEGALQRAGSNFQGVLPGGRTYHEVQAWTATLRRQIVWTLAALDNYLSADNTNIHEMHRIAKSVFEKGIPSVSLA